MRLALTSLDNPRNMRDRVKRALAQLKEQHQRDLEMWRREAQTTKSHAEHDSEVLTSPQGAKLMGSYGTQFDVSKYNALSGSLYALEHAIELLEDVLKRTPEA